MSSLSTKKRRKKGLLPSDVTILSQCRQTLFKPHQKLISQLSSLLSPDILLPDLTEVVIGYISTDCDYNAFEELVYYHSFVAKEERSDFHYSRWVDRCSRLLLARIPEVYSYIQGIVSQYTPPLEEVKDSAFMAVFPDATCNRLKCYDYAQGPCVSSCPFQLNIAWYQQRKDLLRLQRKKRKNLYR